MMVGDLPRTRKEALRQGSTHYFTGKPCKHGHVDRRHVSGDCAECNRGRARRWARENRDRTRANTKRWKKRNPDKVRAGKLRRRWRPHEAPPVGDGRGRKPGARAQAVLDGEKIYLSTHPCPKGHVGERYTSTYACVACTAEDAKSWQEANPCRYSAMLGKGNAIQRAGPDVIPADFDFEATVPFYEERDRLTESTGIQHHVDHKVPLSQGGMHCASNLQVLAAPDHREKSAAERKDS